MNNNIIDFADEVLARADIVEVCSHFIKVEKKGRYYTSLCPFHDDKKLGNFYINQEKGIFKCFACNTGGNAITFVQKITNCSFPEAVRKTAEIIGFHDDKFAHLTIQKQINPEDKKIYDCLEDIAKFYEASLYQADGCDEAQEYLKSRGLSQELIKYFRIGYAQANGENIVNFLVAKGYSLKTISETGIINLNRVPHRDINSNRITFTICDKDNHVVGFSCRKFRKEDESVSKYINTSSTKAFNKSSILFNYYNAINESRKVGYVYLLEGFMDVIACQKIGIKSAIALMGTALTKENIQLLRYLKCEIRVCLDLDGPGQLNMEKVATLLDEAKIPYKMVSNDVEFKEKDSDEILTNLGEERFKKFLTTLITKGEWLINYYSKSLDLNTLDGRKTFLKKLLPFLSSLKDLLDLEVYVNKVSKLTDFNSDTIGKYIQKYNAKLDKKDESALEEMTSSIDFKQNEQKMSKLGRAEHQALYYMLESREAFDEYEKKLSYFTNTTYCKIANILCDYIKNSNITGKIEISQLFNYISSGDLKKEMKDEMINSILTVVEDHKNIPPFSVELFDDLVSTINIEKEDGRIKENYNSSTKGMDDQAKLALLKVRLAKKHDLIEENDKQRRK